MLLLSAQNAAVTVGGGSSDECSSSVHETLVLTTLIEDLAYNPSIWEVKAGGLEFKVISTPEGVKEQPGLSEYLTEKGKKSYLCIQNHTSRAWGGGSGVKSTVGIAEKTRPEGSQCLCGGSHSSSSCGPGRGT